MTSTECNGAGREKLSLEAVTKDGKNAEGFYPVPEQMKLPFD